MTKYRNVKVKLDGYTFDSKLEAKRYGELRALIASREITALEVHPKWTITVKGRKICTYSADFAYWDLVEHTQKTEDVKGVKTAVYRLKKKLMKACHGIDIVEVTK